MSKSTISLYITIMGSFYVKYADKRYYKFSAADAAYPTEILTELGISEAAPTEADAIVSSAGTFADYPIVRVRLVITDTTGDFLSSKIRLCSAQKFSTADTQLRNKTVFGGKVNEVKPVRSIYRK